jgi:hypothetical protein
MCILVVCEPNSTPTKTDLHNGACSNPHGYGFAIIAGDTIISERSMSAKKSIARFLELRKQYPNGYAMWHARYATHGVKNEANCHPFKVGDSDLTYLAHNGILDVTIEKSDKRSDTRVFAEDTLPLMGGVSVLDNDTVWTMVSKWASGSKICILTLDPSAKHQIYLVNENLGTWDNNGIWWSNQSHKRTTYTPPASTIWASPTSNTRNMDKAEQLAYDYVLKSYYTEDGEVLDICPNCEMIVDMYENPYYCVSCEICFDCDTTIVECMCYTPDKNWSSKKNYDLFNQL